MVKALALLLLGTTGLVEKSCSISFGSGSDNPSAPSSYALAVPFFRQSPNYCGPASIEMWAAYDGLPVSQQQIANYIGCSTTVGASPGQILVGVAHFTGSGRDAVLEYNGGVGDPGTPGTIGGEYYSTEITSISALVPVLPIVNGGLHSGVLIGGQWHIDPDSGLYVWDSVLFNDPEQGPGIPYMAGEWTGYDATQHIVSASAGSKGISNYHQYGGQVLIRGAGGGGHPLPY